MQESRSFYVYLLFRVNGVPCYVGKGKGNRWQDHEGVRFPRVNLHLHNIIKQAKLVGKELPKIKLAEHLTEEEAFKIERLFIAAIGREIVGGPLVNLTDGGDGVCGQIVSEETKKKQSAAKKGRTLSERHRREISTSLTGRTLSESHKRNVGLSQKGKKRKPWSNETRAKQKLNNPGHTGHKHTDEAKMKMKIAARNRAATSCESRKKMSEAALAAWAKRKNDSSFKHKEGA